MDVRIIQKTCSIGDTVRISLKSGKEVQGVVLEIGRDHITLESTKNKPITLDNERIELIENVEPEKEETVNADLKNFVTITPTNTQESKKDLPVDSLSLDLMKKLIEIETRYETKAKTVELQLREPDFSTTSPEVEYLKKADSEGLWGKIRNRYENAKKINELDPKFQRVQPIIADLKKLSDKLPTSFFVKRYLTYTYSLAKEKGLAFQNAKSTAKLSRNQLDWYNLAVLSLDSQHLELSCYSLIEYFKSITLINDRETWYRLVDLIKHNRCYDALKIIAESKPDRNSEEIEMVFEAGAYLLKTSGQAPEKMLNNYLREGISNSFLTKIVEALSDSCLETYKAIQMEFDNLQAKKEQVSEKVETLEVVAGGLLEGSITDYRPSENYGFLKSDSETYFFHKTGVFDKELLDKLLRFTKGSPIKVIFEAAATAEKGPIAAKIILHRTPREIFDQAERNADNGDYSNAIAWLKFLLKIDPSYPKVRDYEEKWKNYALLAGVPKGSNPYDSAKRAELVEKDLDKAIRLFQQAIKQRDNIESSIKDLAALLDRQGRSKEAVKVLQENRHKVNDREKIDNVLVNFYPKIGEYEKAIEILQERVKNTPDENKKIQAKIQIAGLYFKKEDYKQSEKLYRELSQQQRSNISLQRNLALCLSGQGKFAEAEKVLNQILKEQPFDTKSSEILDAIKQAKKGELTSLNAIGSNSSGISAFARFFMDSSDFVGVDEAKIQAKNFQEADLDKVEKLAREFKTKKPRDRATYYLSAAKIADLLKEEGEVENNRVYQNLCRSFASRADAAIDDKHIDTVQEFYCEALRNYDLLKNTSSNIIEQDVEDSVKDSLVRFLYSQLSKDEIPLNTSIPTIERTIESVFNKHADRKKLFDAIAYLTFSSSHAYKVIIESISKKQSLRGMAVDYLKKELSSENTDDFSNLWRQLQQNIRRRDTDIIDGIRYLKDKFSLNIPYLLEDGIKQINELRNKLLFELDKKRLSDLGRIFENAHDYCKQEAFEEKERLCIQISMKCKDILDEVENNPTRLSIETFVPLLETIKTKTDEILKVLYESSKPKISIRLAVESYFPNADNKIEVQVVIENERSSSPAESLELKIEENSEFFTLVKPQVKSDRSLRGGTKETIIIPLSLTKAAIEKVAFSLVLQAFYKTRSEETEHSERFSFPIDLSSETNFEEIDNPYASYADGGPVDDKKMFYGREELIKNVAKAIEKSQGQAKCVVIFGQKRVGKSSILYHLKLRLSENKNLIVLDLGNVGSLLDNKSEIPLLHRLLWGVLSKLKNEVEEHTDFEITRLESKDFYASPDKLTYFKEIMNKFKKQCSKSNNWQGKHIVLLIDEFSYIYELIMEGYIDNTFMKTWKALLQENYFSAVLVGQDVMPKFKQQFPNEFGSIQDERVTYLRHEDAIKLIDEPIHADGKSRFRERAIDLICELTACSPYYIQIICNRLVDYMNSKRKHLVTDADVDYIKQELIKGINGLSEDKFNNLINSGDTSTDAISDDDVIKVLTVIAKETKYNRFCSRESINCNTSKPIDYILSDLQQRDVIKLEQSNCYKIQVGLFKDWLIHNK